MNLNQKLLYVLAVALLLVAPAAYSQSTSAGDIAGTVTDASGAVVPNASVDLKGQATGISKTTTTNSQGYYRFSLLPPADYLITVNATGFGKAEKLGPAVIGETTGINFQLTLASQSQTVEVQEAAPALQTDNGDISTTIVSEQLANLPNPGNDLSFVAQLSPGATMNTEGGYGNFEVFGLPGTSNVFTYNGMYDNDPFLNLNNSGATNLLLGQNDVAEVNVVTNGYSGQYGGLAGAQVNYISKSGSNQFHGNLEYFWNGSYLNANDWFNNASGTKRPFDNINQYAGSVGGPIRKNSTFFFYNYEGLRVVLPTSSSATIPSPAFETATIANLNAMGLSASVPFYQNMFNIYNGAPGAGAATPNPGTCSASGITGIASDVCTVSFRSTAGNFTHEYQTLLRIDQNIGSNDRIFGRVQTDQGIQATYTDPINPAFNADSNQPEYQGQLNWTHSFGAKATNALVFSGQYYSALFSADLGKALPLFPTTTLFLDGSLNTLGGDDFVWPQGRNVKQYQVVDDFSYTLGRHTFKLGINYKHNHVDDFDYGTFTSGLVLEDLNSLYNGGADALIQKFVTALHQPIGIYTIGSYVQDEFRLGKNLKITAALRLDHNNIPQCLSNCFDQFNVPFTELNHDPTVPYNQAIQTNQRSAYYSTDVVVWEPRVGFAYALNDKTVLRGGAGIFSDGFPAVVADAFSSNSPSVNQFTVAGGPLSPAQSGNLFSLASQSNASFIQTFNNGGTVADLCAFCAPPSFNTQDHRLRQPHYYEYNFELQREIGWKTVLDLNYVGNRGVYEPIVNNAINAFCPTSVCPSGFLPSAPADSRFGPVTQYQSSGFSTYQGLVVRLSHNFTDGLLFQVNYTWSHALDVCSNGCLNPYNNRSSPSVLFPENPSNATQYNYGNADYDLRNYFSANFVYDDVIRRFFHGGPKAVFGGWTISGTFFARSGLPLTVIDNGAAGALSSFNYGGGTNQFFGNVNAAGVPSCGVGSASSGPSTAAPCLTAPGQTLPNGTITTSGQFSPVFNGTVVSGYGNQSRNQFRGPIYFDTDLSVSKDFRIPGWEGAKFQVGAQFYNVLNHPNFDLPQNNVADTNPVSGFGLITNTVNPPTSILGSFLGGDASPRLIQAKLTFVF